MQEDWFVSWFDTPYYHILYQHRDDTEAQVFIDLLFDTLHVSKKDFILDLACGRGRHAVYINSKGYNIVGYDLAEENINFAKEHENENLKFEVRDMREDLGTAQFDWVFNLFTSFGYFDNDADNLVAMQAIAKSLKVGGHLVLDFMNVHKVEKRLVPTEIKIAQDIEFHINRFANHENIVKEIRFEADGKEWQFVEAVSKLTVEDFDAFFKASGLRPVAYYGNLALDKFNAQTSDRLIMIVQKI